ncbi:unannotated protein [freshwater metagenome]|uniref:Unannotated protein n=1 Tax=freshwater metagenome TaxID=449393 RepID=A0A6J7ERB8_9ZZZZ|nr:hypothetical protein [Actinomycetota bacterium]
MRCALAPLVVVLALVLAGCGGSSNDNSAKSFSGEQAAVAKTVENLQSAASDRDGAKICSELITAALRDRISAQSCPATVRTAIKDTDDVDLIVTKVAVTGTTATATVRQKLGNNKSRVVQLPLVKSSGSWRIAQLP